MDQPARVGAKQIPIRAAVRKDENVHTLSLQCLDLPLDEGLAEAGEDPEEITDDGIRLFGCFLHSPEGSPGLLQADAGSLTTDRNRS